MKIGKPKLFASDNRIRFNQIRHANDRFNYIKEIKRQEIANNIGSSTVLYVKGYGNDPDFIGCFRDLLFNSRELLDSLILKIHRETEGKTKRSFVPFIKNLMLDKYDAHGLSIIELLKENISFIYQMRAMRNEIKAKVSGLEFRFVTNHFELTITHPLKEEDVFFLPYFDINTERAIEDKAYSSIIILDEYFPEVVRFWTYVNEQYRIF